MQKAGAQRPRPSASDRSAFAELVDRFRRYLPGRDCFDIVFRHALDVDGSGDRLAFGSTTGSLWVSENAGERWHPVSSYLPPVYQVLFAS